MAKDMTCPQCGAQMAFNKETRELSCSWCGHKELLPKEPPTQAEIQERGKRRLMLIKLAVFAGIALTIGTIFAVVFLMKTPVDPFEYLDVTFSGINGEGKVNVRVKHNDYFVRSDLDITYNSKAYIGDLNEGDKLKITVNERNDDLRFTSHDKTYTVEGLELFVTDLNSLSDKAVQAIHDKTESLNKRNITPMLTQAEPDLKKAEPKKMMLLTDGDTSNTLFDIYEATFKTSKGDKTVYLMVYFEGLIANGDDIRYDSAMYKGSIITLGEWYDGTLSCYETLKDAEMAVKNQKENNMQLTERVFKQ